MCGWCCLAALACGDAGGRRSALKASGERLAIFAVVALAYILLAGYWQQSMDTLALVLLAVPISMTVGSFSACLAVPAARRPALLFGLDLMQTVPPLPI